MVARLTVKQDMAENMQCHHKMRHKVLSNFVTREIIKLEGILEHAI